MAHTSDLSSMSSSGDASAPAAPPNPACSADDIFEKMARLMQHPQTRTQEISEPVQPSQSTSGMMSKKHKEGATVLKAKEPGVYAECKVRKNGGSGRRRMWKLANSDPELLARRLNTSLTHRIIKGDKRRVCGVCSAGHTKHSRTYHFCETCDHVYLCTKAKPGETQSCQEKWHTMAKLPDPAEAYDKTFQNNLDHKRRMAYDD